VTTRPAAAGLEEAIAGAAAPAVGGAAARELVLLYVNGWRMDLAAVTALVFPAGARRPALVAKIAREGGREGLEVEGRNLELLARAPSARLRASVPRPVAFLELGDRSVLLETALDGKRLVPPRRPARLDRLLDLATDWLVELHRGTAAALGAPAATLDDEGAARHVERPIEEYLRRFRPGERERALLERTRKEAAGLARSGIPLACAHGDFCPPNLFLRVGEGGPALGVIDWETPLAPRLPAGDLIHLLACLGERRGGNGVGPFEEAFLSGSSLARSSRRSLERYARALGLPAEALRPLFVVYWVEYALEKAAATEGEGAATGRAPVEALGVWSLAPFDGASCLVLKRLAERERSLVLP
jgi:aminoglycoside phosphotransferase (APT) family kinase protein